MSPHEWASHVEERGPPYEGNFPRLPRHSAPIQRPTTNTPFSTLVPMSSHQSSLSEHLKNKWQLFSRDCDSHSELGGHSQVWKRQGSSESEARLGDRVNSLPACAISLKACMSHRNLLKELIL